MSVDHYVPNLFLVKRNKRLMIVNGEDQVIYSPPDFLRNFIRDRSEMQRLIDDAQRGRAMIDCVMSFERILSRRMMNRLVQGNPALARMVRFEGD